MSRKDSYYLLLELIYFRPVSVMVSSMLHYPLPEMYKDFHIFYQLV
jgi:hypothetical protein